MMKFIRLSLVIFILCNSLINSFVIDYGDNTKDDQGEGFSSDGDKSDSSTLVIELSDNDKLKLIEAKKYNWIPYEAASGFDNLPNNVVKSGLDINGHTLYVIRAFDNETQSMQVGKFVAFKNYASVLNDDTEVPIDSFQILQIKNYLWSRDLTRNDAVIAGQDADGNNIFVCRALLQVFFMHEGYKTSWTPGELRPNGICAVTYAGTIERFDTYEILKIADEDMPVPELDYIEGEFVYDEGSVNLKISMYNQDAIASTSSTESAVKNYEWTAWNERDTDIPRDAVIGGEDVDGSPLYIVRIGNDNSSLYGKFAIRRRNAYVTNARAEFGVFIFDVS